MKYETVVSKYVDYGQNKFLELSKKKIMPEGAMFFNISKGYYAPDGVRKYQGGIGFPNEKKILNDIVENLKTMLD